jgi:glyoxylase-like metal-dependent hydrolase (beta-lactamase superfamily II)/8-oxo-dGTP pyrophosphatase MutT (NUDIX family)
MERPPGDESGTPVTPRPAATIVLLRPGRDGLEVLLTRRPDSMAFAAGLHVFPGGRVEPSDADPRLVGRARGPRDRASFRIAHRIAAIRETWEEVGVLLAAPEDGPSGARSGEGRDRERPFVDLVEAGGLELLTDRLVEVARWTTPRSFPRRFDARFFVAELPADAVLDPDPREVVDHAWLTPRAALGAMAGGSIAMWPPTSTTLQRLERAVSFDEICDGLARADEPPIAIERISPDLRVMTGQNAFGPTGRPANTILAGRREVVVVDPGDPGEAFVDAVEAEVASRGGRIVAIALTHVDPGHASGSEELHARTGAPIVVGPGGPPPLSWPAIEIGDGATVGTGDGLMTAIATPGHRPDHLAFRTADGTLLAGDALTDRPTFIRPPEGDDADQRRSLARIAALVADGSVRRIVPGHGPPILPDTASALASAIGADR